jgi:hypothetical protein
MVSEQLNTSVESDSNDYSTQLLTEKETKEVLTPFAFTIDKSLFGIYLASAWRRGFALLFDLFFIVLLSDTPSEFLAFVAAVSAYKLGSNPNKDRPVKYGWLRKLTRLLSAIVVFGILAASLPVVINKLTGVSNTEPTEQVLDSTGINVGETTLSVEDSIKFSLLSAKIVKDVAQEKCKSVDCWHDYMNEYVEKYANFNIDKPTAKQAIYNIIEQTKLAEDEKLFLSTRLYDSYLDKLKEVNEDSAKSALDDNNQLNMSNTLSATLEEPIDKERGDKTPTYSIVKYVKALIDDLGLGFGWAALYFTMFTAFWNGQTPGKKLFSIKVVQLDGTPLSVMDSFGRYGGYGAGIATGLLGFLQIFWDANRQGIHDKIASTVVIDLKRKS